MTLFLVGGPFNYYHAEIFPSVEVPPPGRFCLPKKIAEMGGSPPSLYRNSTILTQQKLKKKTEMGFWHQMGLKMNKNWLKMNQKEYNGLKIVCFNQNTRFRSK